jgi:hypothetical protein
VNDKEITEKIRVLISHWIAHNEEHAEEYRKWAARLMAEGLSEIGGPIQEAADLLVASNHPLLSARERLSQEG